MASLTTFGRFLERRAGLQGDQAMRRAVEALSHEDLADISIKRVQPGHITHMKALT